MRDKRIMVVCGFGLGSSMILKMTLDSVLKEVNIKVETFCADEATAKGEIYDIVLTSQPLAHLFEDKKQPTIVINNFLSKEEVKAKSLEIIRMICGF